MIDFSNFYQLIAKNHLSRWLETIPAQIATKQRSLTDRQSKRWQNIVKFLPEMIPYELDLVHSITAQSKTSLSDRQISHIKNLMLNLMPWRKGPFSLYNLYIDAEWKSNWKWQRILPYISNLNKRIVLDVGCGNGYYLWRMLGAGAKLVVGIDPMILCLYQFEAIRKLLGNNKNIYLLPLSIKQLPGINAFDTVFSMGVLYHCISPLEHLRQLRNQLVSDGELILETLVIDGDETRMLLPKDRYAQMHNVYFIPSALMLKNWVAKCGFVDIRIVNICITTTQEQRRTEWMTGDSLTEFLNPNDITKTIEGYPAPMRTILIARKR